MAKETLLTIDQMRAIMHKLIGTKYGSRTAFAKRCGVSAAYISDIMNYRRYPGPKVVKALGFEQVIMFKFTAENSATEK